MLELHGGDHENLTFSNLLINANYHRFIEEMVPLFADRNILYVVNKLANTSKLPFEVEKTFEIGTNCMINDYNMAEEVKKYIDKNNIKGYIILCSAAEFKQLRDL